MLVVGLKVGGDATAAGASTFSWQAKRRMRRERRAVEEGPRRPDEEAEEEAHPQPGVFVGADGHEYCAIDEEGVEKREEGVGGGGRQGGKKPTQSGRMGVAPDAVREVLARISRTVDAPFLSCDPKDSQCVNRSAKFSREVLKRVFDAMAESSGSNDSITEAEFISLCEALKLGLSRVEIARVWRQVDTNQDGKIVFEEFERAIQRRRLLRRIVSAYLVHDAAVSPRPDSGRTSGGKENASTIPATEKSESPFFQVSSTYDYSKTTAETYSRPCEDAVERESAEASSKFAAQRKCVDYGYHGLYSSRRRAWQDAVVNSLAVRIESQTEPWVVYTCGAMGAGKGYALHWLSEHGYFPLENIVHVDPDRFKAMMPEWDGYVEHQTKSAGSLCHQESGYLAEITQEVAMDRRQHVWVDGSLRDADYYVSVFKRLRQRHPQYRFAIFYVYASRQIAWNRVLTRARATGRMVPEGLFNASIAAPAESLRILTPYVDFLARLRNDTDGSPPVLEAFESVDHTGNFDRIKKRFGESEPELEFAHFPERRGARRLKIVPELELGSDDDDDLVLQTQGGVRTRRSGAVSFVVGDENDRGPTVGDDHQRAALYDGQPEDPKKSKRHRKQRPALPENGGFFPQTPFGAASAAAEYPDVRVDGLEQPLSLSRPYVLTLDQSTKARAAVPSDAVFFAYCHPTAPPAPTTADEPEQASALLARHGGFAYLDLQHRILRLVAFADGSRHEKHMIRFLPPVELPLAARAVFRRRWRLLPRGHFARVAGATAHCWLAPLETVLGTRYSPCGGELFLIGAQPDDDPNLQPVLTTADEPNSSLGLTPAPKILLFPIRGAD